MHLHCSFRAELFREEYHQYFHDYDIAVKEYGENYTAEYLVGRALIDKLFWQTAQLDGESLHDICDADSQGWYDVHRAISSPSDPQELREDLEVDDGVSEVLFLHRVLLHPDVDDRIAVLDAMFRAVTDGDAIVVMYNNLAHNTEFTEAKFAALGFAKIAGTDLIYRDCHFQTAYDKAHPRGRDAGLTATQEHEDWILNKWEKR